MSHPASGCADRRHQWAEHGDRRVCRDCGLIDFSWSLSRRQMIEALRRAGSPTPDSR